MANFLESVDSKLESELKEAREAASWALSKFIEAKARQVELEAMIELRRAMGATVREINMSLRMEG